ncbi:MAG: hypothetical protein GY909_07880 [Oligoflexia bacterium]|nr:hypothetical protein [Oligoflexia bacterium]
MKKDILKLHSRQNVFSISNSLKLLFLFLFLISSCVQQGGSNGKRKTSSSGTASNTDTPSNESNTPDFSNSSNYYQNGSATFTGQFDLPSDFQNSFYLRGSGVDAFIRNGNTSAVQCLISVHPNSPGKQVLVQAASPKFFFNFVTNTQEYYYLLDPADSTLNQNFCQTPGILNYFAINFPTYQLAFKVEDICPNCALSNVTSTINQVMNTGGQIVTEINMNVLAINITKGSFSSGGSGSLSCSSSNECQTQGYDCCSLGQCVNDKTLRGDANTSSPEYTQAITDIASNPAAIYNYPQFFHLCASNVPVEPTPTPVDDPSDNAQARFKELESLYNCTTPSEGEMSLCSINYEDIAGAGTTTFETSKDDRNFNTTYSGSGALPLHSIYKVIHAGETLFENNAIIKGMTIGPAGNGTGNDNLDDTQVIDVTHVKANSAPDDNLEIIYKIDGSCERVSSSLAKCYKEYVQGQNDSKVNDHFPASNQFLLPFYADINKTIKIEVDGNQKLVGTHWNLVPTSPAYIQFLGTGLQVYDTQTVKISFFVDLSNHPNTLVSKEAALLDIKAKCSCADTTCRLKPYLDSGNNIIDYICDYPQDTGAPPPVQQTVIVDSKTVPQLYFDTEGVYQEEVNFDTPEQEGEKFEYINNDLLRPNNVDQYIGFNEIYGSFNALTTSAKPAKLVNVVKGKTYDIFTNNGSFATCFFCGTDYYSNVKKMFPSSFLQKGGGYIPHESSNNPFTAEIRQDDFAFGRACWIPATMIPWTHSSDSDRQKQRLKRQSAQHFLFANGYQRDWYGFDYGSLIGSFDGVRWFSVGNQRRIQAKSNKLFLAVNAYFGDQTQSSTYEVMVQDSSSIPFSGATVTSDFESDGAECQKLHVCEKDSDCAATLGWEYSCESISSITTKWPTFDANGSEIPGLEDVVNLRGLFGATTGSPKRCVYRGRGAACSTAHTSVNPTNSYSGTDKPSLHACSNNNYCQLISEGVPKDKFNDRINRFGKSVKVQNSSTVVPWSDEDTFGKGIKVLGRPYDWNGSATIGIDANSALAQNNVSAICIPGRSTQLDTFIGSNQNKPVTGEMGGKVAGIGMGYPLTGAGEAAPNDFAAHFLSSCGVFDEDGNYFYNDATNASLSMGSTLVTDQAATQALSTKSLAVFETLTGNDFVKNYESSYVDVPSLEENRCMRAPGSTCHSDIDCGPSDFITARVSTLNPEEPSVSAVVNEYELKFWQEPLICSQEKVFGDDDFDHKNNRCCRPTGSDSTVGVSEITSVGAIQNTVDSLNIPGVTSSLTAVNRYSKVATTWNLTQDPSTSFDYPLTRVAASDICGGAGCLALSVIEKQFNTFDAGNTRTCCSGDWIRNFSDEQGGGHSWSPGKMQSVPKNSFKCMNWDVCTTGDGNCGPGYFNCDHTDSPNDGKCRAHFYSDDEAEPIFDWVETLELTGVPQIAVKSADFSEVLCRVNPTNQEAAGNDVMPDILKGIVTDIDYADKAEYADAGRVLFSANYQENFDDDNMKKVFSPDKISCCLPLNSDVPDGADASICCSGFVNGQNNKCQLPDYSNLSVYFNRYISSAAKDEPVSSFDATTGYLNSTSDVIRLACQQNACASGRVRTGISLSNLKVKGHETSDVFVKRFVDGDDQSNNQNGFSDLYDAGLRWNTHIYCVPVDSTLDGIVECDGNF